MSELQRKNESQINAVKHRPERSNTCSKCGLHHQHGYCPAQGSTCSACGRKNHWDKMCQQARKKLTGSHKQTGLPNIKNLDQPSLHLKTGRAVLMFRTRCVTNLRECLSIQCVTTKKKCPRSEASATLDVILPNRKGIHDLKIKVDTGAE